MELWVEGRGYSLYRDLVFMQGRNGGQKKIEL